MLILNADDVASVLTMPDCIAAMAEALSGLSDGTCRQPSRSKVSLSSVSSFLGLMPAYRTGSEPRWGFKYLVVVPENRRRGIDTHQGAVLLSDGQTGRLVAVIDATALTAIRTAAVSAVATKALARGDATVVAIIGTGHQAKSHVEAMRTVLPSARIVIGARTKEASRSFAEAVRAEPAASIREAVAEADVVCTVTSSREPVLKREWIKQGCHLNVVGASDPACREVDGALVAASEFFVDSRAQATLECGEYLLALREGAVNADHARAELGEVLNGRHPGRSGPEAITLFKSLGLAVEDLAAAELALDRARAEGRGIDVPW